MRAKTATTVAIVAALVSQPAFGRGESLFQVGKGLTFREYTAPLPDNILSVARTENSPGLVWYPLLVDSPCLQRYADDIRYVQVVNSVEERMLTLQEEVHESL